MATRKKTKKHPVRTFEFKNSKWSVSPDASSGLATLVKNLVSTSSIRVPRVPIEEVENTNVRIVVAVAERPIYVVNNGTGFKQASVKLECGRAGAQAAHAVSKLKLSYIAEQAQGKPESAYDLVLKMMEAKVTTIEVKARDTRELEHIEHLAKLKGMSSVRFYDENPSFYGDVPGRQVWTAVAVGPCRVEDFHGVTDYLPLWKCNCDDVH